MSQSLPLNPYRINTPSREHNAYATCLAYEAEAIAGSHSVISGIQPVTLARVLGYLILHAPTELGRANISNDVTSCGTRENLADMARLYVTTFICYFNSAEGPTPAPSSHPSRPPFDNVPDTFIHMLVVAPQSHQNAKKLALVRDNYRCVISGRVDSTMFETNPEVQAAARLNPNMRLTLTHCAHVFPESTNHNINGESEGDHKHQHASAVWTIMERFGQVLGVDELNGPQIHRLENVMTMDVSFHQWFDSLVIWLEATQTINQYNARATNPIYIADVQNPIALSTNHDIPAPDPRYLKLHAACAQVAHLSGAAKYIDDILRDMEELGVLEKDGSSSDLLYFKLSLLTMDN
ncbi:hypothetical protein FIBSPDRAFT_823867 [Athelia psychrophila]|uniref:HNH nuclease domain-containing protein n=1 Tax=Athelia psychrophila TaxID=1759441 RepID=A0A166LIR8_9AGAM|nr:hypothetical protein FIBSPDRAFT_823867 [Fibularhizoctonia sp. CBS 109695]